MKLFDIVSVRTNSNLPCNLWGKQGTIVNVTTEEYYLVEFKINDFLYDIYNAHLSDLT